MNMKFLIAWLVIFALWMFGGFAVHGWLLQADYAATGMFRPEEEQQQFMIWMLLAHATMAAAFVWIYARGLEAKAWLGQGLRYGLAVALLAVIPIYLIYYCVLPMPAYLVVKQIVFDTIVALILGVVVAFIYRGQGRT